MVLFVYGHISLILNQFKLLIVCLFFFMKYHPYHLRFLCVGFVGMHEI